MLKKNRCALVGLGAFASLLLAGSVYAFPSDVVPRGHIAYDLLGSLAGAGRLPGYTLADFFRGDRLYTRAEIANLVASLAEVSGANQTDFAQKRLAAMERALRMEFAPELSTLGANPFPNSALPATTPGVTAHGKLRGVSGPVAGTATGRVSLAVPFGRDGYAGLVVGNWRDEWYDTKEAAHRSNRLGFNRLGYPAVETLFARQNGRVLDVSIGRMPLRFGPGYVGGLLASDEAKAVDQIRVEKQFRLPGTFGRSFGFLQFTQVYGQFFEENEPAADPVAQGTRRHLAVRRLETSGDRRFHFAFAESYKSTRLPDPFWSQVLPFYLYQNDWTKDSRRRIVGFLVTDKIPNTRWLNYLANASVSYRPDNRGSQIYYDYLLDDLKAPQGLGLGNITPRKVGQQFGIYLPDLGGFGAAKRVGLRLEVATIDPLTYTNVSAPIAWAYDGLPLGTALGPNATSFFGRVDARVSPRVRVAVEGLTRRRRSSDPATPQLPTGGRLGVYGLYDVAPNAFAGLRLEHSRVEPFNGKRDTQTRIEVNVGAGF